MYVSKKLDIISSIVCSLPETGDDIPYDLSMMEYFGSFLLLLLLLAPKPLPLLPLSFFFFAKIADDDFTLFAAALWD